MFALSMPRVSQASQEELDRMIDEIDKDGDGTIDFNGESILTEDTDRGCRRVLQCNVASGEPDVYTRRS